MAFTRRQKLALVLIGVLLAPAMFAGFGLAEDFVSGFFATSGPTHWNATGGPEVIVPADYNLRSGNPFTVESYNLSTENSGHVNLSSSGSTVVQVDQIKGTWTNVSALDVSGTTLTIDPGDKAAADIKGSASSFGYKGTITADDGVVDFTYSGGPTNITLRNAPASTQLGAIDADTGAVLDVATSGGGGTVTFTDLESGSHNVVLATGTEPTFINSSASPTGELSTATPTLSIPVNDTDFNPGDNVTVEWYVDGSKVATEFITSNTTVTHTTSALDGGEHTWHVEATDAYGNTNVSHTFTMSTPDELLIRDETAPDTLVTDAQVNITAYYSDDIIRRQTSDGSVNLTGFPVDEPIIVRAQADGYYTRTVVIDDIFEQQAAYLLNESEAAYLVRFDLQDPTGQFDREDTVLFVDRDLNVSGNISWVTIAGDNFGIQGVTVNLVQDERYRIRIKNLETNTTVGVGTYTAIQSETVTLSPGEATITFEDVERSYTWEARQNDTAQTIVVEYAEEDASQTADVKITIHERFNTSNVLVDNQTFTDVNSLVFQESLSNAEVNKTWSLVLYVDRGDGYMRFGPTAIGSGARDLIPVDLDPVWRNAIGVFVLLISSLAFSQLNRGVGAVATAIIGGLLWYIGLLALVATGPAVVFAIAIGFVYHYRTWRQT